jgi:hypothetical protein
LKQALDLIFETFFFAEQPAKLAPDGGYLALQSFLLLTQSFRQLDGAVNFVFQMRELFES